MIPSSESALLMMVCIWPRKKRAVVGLRAPGSARITSKARFNCTCGVQEAVIASTRRTAAALFRGDVAAVTDSWAQLGKRRLPVCASHLSAVDLIVWHVLGILERALRVADDQLPNLLAALVQYGAAAEVQFPDV